MDKLGFYAFEVVVVLYLVTCFLVYRYSGWYWRHDFFSLTSLLTAMASCGLVWTALYCKMTHGDPNFFQKNKPMLITAAILLYASIVIFNFYKTGFKIGLFGSLIQASVYVFLALFCYKAVIFFLVLMPFSFVVSSGSGGVRTVTETVYRTRNC